jgi:N-acetylmuramoyl-L-alanine amidase
LPLFALRPRLIVLALVLLCADLANVTFAIDQNAQNAYTVVMPGGRRSLAVRGSGNRETIGLDQVSAVFGVTVNEDPGIGLTITARGQRILLIPGQAFAQVSGQVVSLSAPVERDRTGWTVPIDFLSAALARAMGTRIEVRRDRKIILVGDVLVPHVTGRFVRQGAGGRLEFEIVPPAAHRLTRDGKTLLLRFDADLVDADPTSGLNAPDLVAGVRVEGTTIRIDLGPSAASYMAGDDRNQTRLTIDLLPPGPPPAPPTPPPPVTSAPVAPPPVRPTAPQEPAALEVAPPGGLHTIVIDPGHGGDDEGVKGASGLKEKDLTLQIARRLKVTMESRWGLRVLLTRDGDDNVPLDRRTELANNNKADLFLSLHVNAAMRASVRGAQVLTLSLDAFKDRTLQAQPTNPPLPVIGGGVRSIDPVPWDTAQIPFARRSASLAAAMVQRLMERGIPLRPRPAVQAPLRVLMGANMPAVLIEVGFLTNPDDERSLGGPDLPASFVEAILATIADFRAGFRPEPRP